MSTTDEDSLGFGVEGHNDRQTVRRSIGKTKGWLRQHLIVLRRSLHTARDNGALAAMAVHLESEEPRRSVAMLLLAVDAAIHEVPLVKQRNGQGLRRPKPFEVKVEAEGEWWVVCRYVGGRRKVLYSGTRQACDQIMRGSHK